MENTSSAERSLQPSVPVTEEESAIFNLVRRQPGLQLDGRLFYILLMVIILMVLAFVVIDLGKDRQSEVLPVSLQSPLQADYSTDENALLHAPLDMNIISEAVRDRSQQLSWNSFIEPENPLATFVSNLLTPVPTITPMFARTSNAVGSNPSNGGDTPGLPGQTPGTPTPTFQITVTPLISVTFAFPATLTPGATATATLTLVVTATPPAGGITATATLTRTPAQPPTPTPTLARTPTPGGPTSTATSRPPAATATNTAVVPPSATPIPPTATRVPPSATPVQPTATRVPPTATQPPPPPPTWIPATLVPYP